MSSASVPFAQTGDPTPSPTPTPGVGPAELVDFLPALVRAGWFVAGALVIVAVGWYVVEPSVRRVVRQRNPDNRTLQEAFSRYVRVVVLLVAVFAGAIIAGYGRVVSDSALVVAAATLAVGVAAQAVIGSLVSGLVLVFDPEFSVGDYIRWADGEGVVESITLRITRVRTPEDELVTVPNTSLTSQPVVRPFRGGRVRAVEGVEIAYEAEVGHALSELETAAASVDGVVTEPGPTAYVDELGGNGVLLHVRYWISEPRNRDVPVVRSAVERAMKSGLEAAGITISPAVERELDGRIAVEDDRPAGDGSAE